MTREEGERLREYLRARTGVLRARIAVRLLGSRLGLSALAFLRRRRRPA
jgi:hypothetical protein